MTIMIVGANADFSYLMQRYVRQSGHRMVVAQPQDDMPTLIRREKPVAIILEADLPDAVGWDVLRALKADQATQAIPVVVCSWLDQRANSLAEGAASYLRKPVLYEDFLAALAEAGAPMQL